MLPVERGFVIKAWVLSPLTAEGPERLALEPARAQERVAPTWPVAASG
jgi:hypothetical protein